MLQGHLYRTVRDAAPSPPPATAIIIPWSVVQIRPPLPSNILICKGKSVSPVAGRIRPFDLDRTSTGQQGGNGVDSKVAYRAGDSGRSRSPSIRQFLPGIIRAKDEFHPFSAVTRVRISCGTPIKSNRYRISRRYPESLCHIYQEPYEECPL